MGEMEGAFRGFSISSAFFTFLFFLFLSAGNLTVDSETYDKKNNGLQTYLSAEGQRRLIGNLKLILS